MGKGNRLIFINLFYWPDVAATGQNLTDLAEFLAKHRFKVTVITSKLRYQSGQHQVPFYEQRNGVDIYRVPVTSFGRSSTVGRLLDYVTFFVLAAGIALMKLRSFDTIITLTTPPFIGVIGRFVQKLFHKHHLIWPMDLHPEAEFRLGMIKSSSPVARLLTAISSAVTKNADHIVSLGKNMSGIIKERYGVDEAQITEIKIWSSKTDISPQPREAGLHLLPDAYKNHFVIQYSGNMGLVHHFQTFCQTIQLFKTTTLLSLYSREMAPGKRRCNPLLNNTNSRMCFFCPT